MISVKHGGIKYHFLSLWYDSTRDWNPVSRALEELSNHEAFGLEEIEILNWRKYQKSRKF